MTDLITGKPERGLRLIYGKPEVVEEQVDRLGDTYVVTGMYYYVVDNHLEVCAQLVHSREFRKQQLAQAGLSRGGRIQ